MGHSLLSIGKTSGGLDRELFPLCLSGDGFSFWQRMACIVILVGLAGFACGDALRAVFFGCRQARRKVCIMAGMDQEGPRCSVSWPVCVSSTLTQLATMHFALSSLIRRQAQDFRHFG